MTHKEHLILGLEKEIFGQEFTDINIRKSEILDICDMRQVNVVCVIVYIRYAFFIFSYSLLCKIGVIYTNF